MRCPHCNEDIDVYEGDRLFRLRKDAEETALIWKRGYWQALRLWALEFERNQNEP